LYQQLAKIGLVHVGNYHWVLDVAVNPFCMISVVTGATLGEYGDSLLYGFLHIDLWKVTIETVRFQPVEKH
jgi:hypothetical protein